jgi:hypothetical protein
MEKTITVRIDSRKDKALALRARASGKTKSDVIRELIDKLLEPEPLGRRVAHLAGSVELPSPTGSLQRRLKSRNWRD